LTKQKIGFVQIATVNNSSLSGSEASSIDMSNLEGEEEFRKLNYDAEFYIGKQREDDEEEERNYK